MMVLDDLKYLGYEVQVKENNIKLSYKGEGKPDKSKVMPLIERLKVSKNDVIRILQETESVAPPVEKLCKCECQAIDYAFDNIEGEKKDWAFYCSTCSSCKLHVLAKIQSDKNDDITNVSAEGVEAINKVKSVFPDSTVVDISKRKNTECNSKKVEICAKCGNLAKRFCFGETRSGKYDWDMFCLECEPHHF